MSRNGVTIFGNILYTEQMLIRDRDKEMLLAKRSNAWSNDQSAILIFIPTNFSEYGMPA